MGWASCTAAQRGPLDDAGWHAVRGACLPAAPHLPCLSARCTTCLGTQHAPHPWSPPAALQVKVQTVPGYARGIADGLPKFVQQEGVGGLFKGLTPLWGRQIPYTMMKFGEPGCRRVAPFCTKWRVAALRQLCRVGVYTLLLCGGSRILLPWRSQSCGRTLADRHARAFAACRCL